MAYIAYMNAVRENRADELIYEQYRADGSTEWTKTKRSKWDWDIFLNKYWKQIVLWSSQMSPKLQILIFMVYTTK